MKESFYQIYKAARDMVEELRHKDLDPICQEFVDSNEVNCKRYDKSNPDFYTRWKKERNGE